MSKIIAASAIRGAAIALDRAGTLLGETIVRRGRDAHVGFEGTAYALPVVLAMTGRRVEKLGDLEEAVGEARAWLPPVPDDRVWLPYLGAALDAGAATLVAHEAV